MKVAWPIFLLLIVVGLLVPFAYLWALNTLFPVLALEYSFVNYLAVCLIHAFLRSDVFRFSIKK